MLADVLLPGADHETVDWFARWQRASAEPAVAVQVASVDYDVSDVLPDLRVPTLVMHRQEDTMMPFREGQELASRIRHARFAPLDGKIHPCFLGDVEAILRLTAEFLGDPAQPVVQTIREIPDRQVSPASALTFAASLRQYRRAAGMSQEVLAERAGLSVRGLSDLERGVRQAPYAETIGRIAEALGLDRGERAALAKAASPPARAGLESH